MWYYTDLPVLLNMTFTGSFIILFVLLARFLLRKAPKIYSYALWAVVLFRLLCPVSFSAPVSLLGALDAPAATQSHTVEYISPTIVHDPYPSIDIPVVTVDKTINAALPQGQEQLVADPLEAPVSLATLLWVWGMAAMGLYSILSLLFLKRRLVGAAPLGENVYLVDHIQSPFVLGLFRPKIYLPSTLSEREQGYILLHERHHIRRGDHIWKLLGFLALCLHWFNPLAWVSFVLGVKDMEMSCDEAVLKTVDADIRADYSASLLSLATGRPVIAGTPLAFGEGDTKSRVKNALKWREAPVWVRALGAVACGVVIALCAANPAAEDATAPEPFGHSYRISEVLYDDPHSGSAYESWVTGSFTLSSDYSMSVREGNTWLFPGSFQETTLTKENFDSLFSAQPFSGTAKDLRENNKTAWVCTASEAPATALYYLMLQKDGAVLMAQGHTPGLSASRAATISWVWEMEQVSLVLCNVITQDGAENQGHLDWYSPFSDVDLEAVPTMTVYGSGSLGFTVEGEPETLTVEEHYYARRGDDTTINKTIHTLYPATDGVFYLPVERQDNYDDYAIYYVAHDKGRYVLRINFPFAADTSAVTAEQVEAMFAAEYPDAVVLDSVLAYDGKYEVVGVVLYQEQSDMLHLAYVTKDGWSYPVGLGGGETPLSPVEDGELTYLGNGTVSWLCAQGDSLLRYRMEFSVTGSHVAFRPTSAPATDTPPYGYYVTGEQIYKSLNGGTLYPDGDNGMRYFLYKDTLTVTERATGASTTYPVTWNWASYPYEETPITPKIFLEENVLWQTVTDTLALAFIGGQLMVVDNKPELANVFTLIPDTGYIPTSPLLSAVTEAVSAAFFHNNSMNAYGCASHIILDTRELMYDAAIGVAPAGGKLTVVDLIALGMDFHVVEGTLTPMRERVLEMTLTFEEEDGGYVLTDKESTVLPDTGDYGLPLYQGCYSQALTYFGIDAEAAVAQLFDAMGSSPAHSSNPGDYISAHGREHTDLLFYGDYTLRFMFKQFFAGDQTGLQGHLMRAVLDELAPESALETQAATGQAYFDQWFLAARAMEEEIGIARMGHEYPAGWLALRLAEGSAAAPAAVFTAALPLDMMFCSGAGAWQTNLTLNPDLTFSGEHRDDDIGTCYLCRFSGRFENLTPVNRYACTMDLAELDQETESGQEWQENGVRHVAVGPYGMEEGGRFTLYLPGAPTADFPQDFWFWYQGDDRPEALPCYALVNENTGDVFFTALP